MDICQDNEQASFSLLSSKVIITSFVFSRMDSSSEDSDQDEIIGRKKATVANKELFGDDDSSSEADDNDQPEEQEPNKFNQDSEAEDEEDIATAKVGIQVNFNAH